MQQVVLGHALKEKILPECVVVVFRHETIVPQ